MNTLQSMRGRYALAGLLAVIMAIGICQTSFGQSEPVVEIVHVNIDREWPSQDPEDGESWTTAYRFLQDGLFRANQLLTPPTQIDEVEIWVAAGTYRPDQRAANGDTAPCAPYGDCNRNHSFEMQSNVRILGGFEGGEISEDERDPAIHITILSGDLVDDDDFQVGYDGNGRLELTFDGALDNSFVVVKAHDVNDTAVLDGFTVRGGIDLASAQPRFRDCVIQLHEAAAVCCDDASHVMMYRCTFENLDCDSIAVEGQSRLELLLCEPAAVLGGMVGVAQRDSHASPLRRDAWQPRDDAQRATGCGRARVATGSELLVIDQQRWDELVDE